LLNFPHSRAAKVVPLMRKAVSEPAKVLAILVAALVCAGVGNRFAGPHRKLDWTGWAPSQAVLPTAPPPAPPGPAPRALAAPAPPPPAKAARTPGLVKAPPAPAPATPFAPDPDQVIREISSDAALAAFRLKIPFLDARRSADYQAGHLPGAWSVPIWEADAAARITEFEARANPSPQSPIGIYCAGGDCADSKLLAEKLVRLGYRNLLIYRDGFPDWVKQGRPQEPGARP
jgi:rhodanese-related sulfurtransferase